MAEGGKGYGAVEEWSTGDVMGWGFAPEVCAWWASKGEGMGEWRRRRRVGRWKIDVLIRHGWWDLVQR